MSFQSRRELLVTVAPRYKEADRENKTIILNEFIAATGYARKYAIRLLSKPKIPTATVIKRPRSRFYGEAVKEALLVAWAASNYIASKRLAPFLAELVPILERHGHLEITDTVRSQLKMISPATIDRLLGEWRKRHGIRGISLTRSGKLLKHQIPVRTFADWEEKKPGFFEADLVAHCGWSVEGSFLHTLVLTDIATGWVECLPLLHRSGQSVVHAINRAKELVPFPILGVDTDNGSEFINNELVAYCDRNRITFTRGRAYKKNDQCFVEQKNGAVVRQLIGYDRFEGQHAYRQLSELYRAVRLYINFFQPSMKMLFKKRLNGRVRRKYDTATTPFKRLSNTDVIKKKRFDKLVCVYKSLDPVLLLKQIKTLQDALWKHAVLPTQPYQSQKAGINRLKKFTVLDNDGMPAKDVQGSPTKNIIAGYSESSKRKYRKTEKSRKPRWWRTRKDPFEEVWLEIKKMLECNPERTAISLLAELKKQYPDKYNDSHLRTLQRRVKKWRSDAIITFDDAWIYDQKETEKMMVNSLQAIIVENAEY